MPESDGDPLLLGPVVAVPHRDAPRSSHRAAGRRGVDRHHPVRPRHRNRLRPRGRRTGPATALVASARQADGPRSPVPDRGGVADTRHDRRVRDLSGSVPRTVSRRSDRGLRSLHRTCWGRGLLPHGSDRRRLEGAPIHSSFVRPPQPVCPAGTPALRTIAVVTGYSGGKPPWGWPRHQPSAASLSVNRANSTANIRFPSPDPGCDAAEGDGQPTGRPDRLPGRRQQRYPSVGLAGRNGAAVRLIVLYGGRHPGARVTSSSPAKRVTRLQIPPGAAASVAQRPRALMTASPTSNSGYTTSRAPSRCEGPRLLLQKVPPQAVIDLGSTCIGVPGATATGSSMGHGFDSRPVGASRPVAQLAEQLTTNSRRRP